MASTDFSINRQNDAEALRYRAAADRHYAKDALARRLEGVIVVGSIALGFFASGSSALQLVPALWALAFAVVESSLLYHVVLTNRHAGAELSDCFDRYLFSEVPNLHLPFPDSLDAVAALFIFSRNGATTERLHRDITLLMARLVQQRRLHT
jgi:hypothetical protein